MPQADPRKPNPQRTRPSKAADLVRRAKKHLAAGQHGKASNVCQDAVKSGTLTPLEASEIVGILRQLGQTDSAGELDAKTCAEIASAAANSPDDHQIALASGQALLELEHPEAAEPHLRRALDLDPTDRSPAFMLLNILLQRQAPDALIEVWKPVVKASKNPGAVLLTLAKGLGHFGFPNHAESVLDQAEPYFVEDRKYFDHIAAAIRGNETSISQRDMAVEVFDRFAPLYDSNLAAINNAGPRMIGRLLEAIALPKNGDLAILDAGCGTGLCAPYLRPYARALHGCDVSVQMLETSRRKKLYDLLTRTDLSVRATFPDEKFDLLVVADVLVYFGDLAPILENLAAQLRPGGWIVFTVELAADDAASRGYRLGASGRYAHSASYIKKALTAVGLTTPKATLNGALRLEFGAPVEGQGVAAQKLALLGR